MLLLQLNKLHSCSTEASEALVSLPLVGWHSQWEKWQQQKKLTYYINSMFFVFIFSFIFCFVPSFSLSSWQRLLLAVQLITCRKCADKLQSYLMIQHAMKEMRTMGAHRGEQRIFHSLLAQPSQQANCLLLGLCKGTVSSLWKLWNFLPVMWIDTVL